LALVFRGRRFFTIPEVAEQLGVTRLTVYRWVRGMRGSPDGLALDDVIRDTRTGRAYIPEALVRRLRSSLRRGRPRGSRRGR